MLPRFVVSSFSFNPVHFLCPHSASFFTSPHMVSHISQEIRSSFSLFLCQHHLLCFLCVSSSFVHCLCVGHLIFLTSPLLILVPFFFPFQSTSFSFHDVCSSLGSVASSLYSPIHTALWVRESRADSLHRPLCGSFRCGKWGQLGCGSNAPPEVASEPQQRRAGVCVNGYGCCVDLMVFTVWKLNRSFTNQIKEKWHIKQHYTTKQQ